MSGCCKLTVIVCGLSCFTLTQQYIIKFTWRFPHYSFCSINVQKKNCSLGKTFFNMVMQSGSEVKRSDDITLDKLPASRDFSGQPVWGELEGRQNYVSMKMQENCKILKLLSQCFLPWQMIPHGWTLCSRFSPKKQQVLQRGFFSF